VDLIVIGPIGSRAAHLTVTRDAKLGWAAATGCFRGSLKDLRSALVRTHKRGRFGREYGAALAFVAAIIKARKATPR
jgi:hypothetical protein